MACISIGKLLKRRRTCSFQSVRRLYKKQDIGAITLINNLVDRCFRTNESPLLLILAISIAMMSGFQLGKRERPRFAGQGTLVRSDNDFMLLKNYLHPPDDKTVVVEFLDFECPACRASWPTVDKWLSENQDIEYIPVIFPLPQHKEAYFGSMGFCVG